MISPRRYRIEQALTIGAFVATVAFASVCTVNASEQALESAPTPQPTQAVTVGK